MTKVVQADAIEARVFANVVPGFVEVVQTGALLLARKHPGIAGGTGKAGQHLGRCGRERHHPCAGLAIEQPYRREPFEQTCRCATSALPAARGSTDGAAPENEHPERDPHGHRAR